MTKMSNKYHMLMEMMSHMSDKLPEEPEMVQNKYSILLLLYGMKILPSRPASISHDLDLREV